MHGFPLVFSVRVRYLEERLLTLLLILFAIVAGTSRCCGKFFSGLACCTATFIADAFDHKSDSAD